MKDSKADGLKPISELISLNGKKALVTGSAQGIGKAIAYRLVEAGASLELVDIDEETLKTVKEELTRNEEINIHRVDLSKREEIERLWKTLSGREPDILVNNAGIYPSRDFVEVDEALLEKVMKVNLHSVFWMCQHMIKARKGRGGTIINIGSIEAVLPFGEGLTHYGTSKAGVIALTRALAREYGKEGFKINALVPGGIRPTGAKNIAKQVSKLNLGVVKTGLNLSRRLPLGRFGQPDDVALMTLVLSSGLSGYVQGAVIPVDGGFLSA
jgi:NAD(P)-dependent dehydrogenase (short-subunit alcohol dehydrogenase family)